jgi:hypothetical protein
MSHIQGHIEESMSSCGILKPKLEGLGYKHEFSLFFIPPCGTDSNEWATPETEVTFDVVEVPTAKGQSVLVAYNVRQRENGEPPKEEELKLIMKHGRPVGKLSALKNSIKAKASESVLSYN